MKVNKNLIARIWKGADLKPHRLERYMASNDPQFEEKAAAIIGLYLNPPQNAAVFCVDENRHSSAGSARRPLAFIARAGRKTRLRILPERDALVVRRPESTSRRGHRPDRRAAHQSGVRSLRFLEEVVSTQPAGQQIHVILDNFASHKTDLVKDFLQLHPNVNLHFTPTYSSWLNQVESWFSKLQRDVIDRGIFTSVADLKRKIVRYLRLYQKSAKPFQWRYSDVRKRIPAS